jgi:hypothetical protein
VTAGSPVLRTCAFGDLSQRLWGAVWALDTPGDAFVAVGDGSHATTVSATLDGAGSGADWVVEGAGVQLTLSGGSEPAESPDAGPAGFDQRCRVSGSLELAGARREVSCIGYRAARDLGGPIDRYESIRAVSALLEPDEAIGLLAVRPRRANGHEADAISAAVFEQDGVVVVDDPRLSTTYAEDGHPTRAALELWVADEQGEHRLRRAAGEALGAHATGGLDGLHARVDLFGWHSHGRDGIGVYLLARRP